jgi:hypothetical protein
VTDVQVTVGLRREPGVDGSARITAALGDVLVDKGVDEIFAFGDFSHIKNPLSESILLETIKVYTIMEN